MSINCTFCGSDDSLKKFNKNDGLNHDVSVCRRCWSILQSGDDTSIRLLTGDLFMKMRGVVEPEVALKLVDIFKQMTSKWSRSKCL